MRGRDSSRSRWKAEVMSLWSPNYVVPCKLIRLNPPPQNVETSRDLQKEASAAKED